MKKITLKGFLNDVKLFIMCILVVLVFQHNVGLQAGVPTGSMEPTVNTGDHIIVNCLTYKFNDPKPGEIIAFYHKEEGKFFPIKYLKRVIACPHDTVDIRNGKVYVNDTLIDESRYLSEDIETNEFLFELPYTLGDDEYFVLGDNRAISNDSRVWGTVDRSDILGKAELVFFPIKDAHKLDD